jgi:hypothetical protein
METRGEKRRRVLRYSPSDVDISPPLLAKENGKVSLKIYISYIIM